MVEREGSCDARAGKAPDAQARPQPPPRALAAAVGNRAFARLARSGGERRQLQRMLVQIGSGYAESENARRLRESNPLEYRSGPISALQDGEVLHLVAHSGGNVFGDRGPRALFKWLRDEGLKPGVAAVQLHGCESAAFADKFFQVLNTRAPGWNPTHLIGVQGVPGYHFVSAEGRSYSVGDTAGDEALWTRMRDSVMADPSDENIAAWAQKARDRGYGSLIEIQNLRSAAAALRATREGVRVQLEREVTTVRGDNLTFARDDLASLARRIDALIRITGAKLSPAARAGRGELTVRRGLNRAFEVLDHLFASARSKHLKGHLAKPEARASLERLRAIRASLRRMEERLPGSIGELPAALEQAAAELTTLKRLIARAPGASREARAWMQGFEARLGSAIPVVRDVEVDDLKGWLQDTLERIDFGAGPADAPAPRPQPPAPSPSAPRPQPAAEPNLIGADAIDAWFSSLEVPAAAQAAVPDVGPPTEAPPLPPAPARRGELTAGRGLNRALEVLDHLFASARSKHLKGHLAKPEARASLERLRASRADLRRMQERLPGSIDQLPAALEKGAAELTTLKRLITHTPGASREARTWMQGFEARLSSAIPLVRDVEAAQQRAAADAARPAVPDVPPPAEAPPPPPAASDIEADLENLSMPTGIVEGLDETLAALNAWPPLPDVPPPAEAPPPPPAASDIEADLENLSMPTGIVEGLDETLAALDAPPPLPDVGPPTEAPPPPPTESTGPFIGVIPAATEALEAQDAALKQLVNQ